MSNTFSTDMLIYLELGSSVPSVVCLTQALLRLYLLAYARIGLTFQLLTFFTS
jgi:hypothetical protein